MRPAQASVVGEIMRRLIADIGMKIGALEIWYHLTNARMVASTQRAFFAKSVIPATN